jgi:cation diffusion facilitator family transporter
VNPQANIVNSPKISYTHDHMFLGESHDENTRRTLWVVALTIVMMVVEITAGYLTGSMALLADGFHMATHAGALGIAAAAYGYAKRHASSPRYSFGTGKVGDLGGFASALILGIVSLGIGAESVMRLLQPTDVQFGTATLIAIAGLIVNIVSAVLLGHGHSHQHDHDHDHGDTHGHHEHDNNLQSAYMHVIADALTSVLAIAALLAGRYLGWVWLDPVMGIVGAIVIARWAWTLMRATAAVLLDQTDTHVAQEIRELVEKPGDATITDLHVWRVGPQAHAAIVSVFGQANANADTIRERLRHVHEISHLTVEFRTA